MKEFFCLKCDISFWLSGNLVDTYQMIFIETECGIHCPQCRDNNSVILR